MQEREAGGDLDRARRPLGPGALESPGRTPSPPKCIPVLERPGAPGFPGKTWREKAGAPRDHLGAPGTRPREGVGLRFGAAYGGAPVPCLSPGLPGFGGGKETGRFFLMKKKSGLPGSPSPQPSQQILSEESAPPPGISAAGTLPGRGRAGGEAEESSTCHFLRL